MIYAFWGTLAGVLVLFLAAAHQAIPTFGAPEPTGAHHKPRAPREWPWGERVAFRANARIARRQAERDRDAAWLREAQEIHAEQHMDTMPRGPVAEWPLMPLPPEVREQVPTLAEIREHEAAREAAGTGHLVPVAWLDAQDEPRHDPLAVLGCDEVADAYVGDLGPAELEETSQPPGSELSRTLEGSSNPEPPLFDTSADHWREDTLLGMPAVKL